MHCPQRTFLYINVPLKIIFLHYWKLKVNSFSLLQGSIRYMKKRELFFNLNEHVKRNVLQLDKTFYLQGIGIPQGSILSSLLCSLYYGHLERNVIFPFLDKNCELATEDLSRRHNCQDASVPGNSSENRVSSSCYMLLRLIDDFCFISTSKRLAAAFYTRLQGGFPDYNCYMNEDKFCLNFDARHASGLPSNRVYVGEDGISFIRWSGLLLKSCTLEVQADYTRLALVISCGDMHAVPFVRLIYFLWLCFWDCAGI